ncbi:MAG: flagellar basal body P-ring protein FlgI [Pirellulales bacterium]|nr:flagellar basal body P-ring protein FlgI [Pirellulales bacterium]
MTRWSRSLAMAFSVSILLGCSAWNPMTQRGQSPDGMPEKGSKTPLVGDLAVPFGEFPVTIETFGLVSGLPGTGSDPAPSAPRAALLQEMRARGVAHASLVLASKDTALVLVRGVLRPGIQEGDRFDLEVRVPGQSETTNLRGGWLLEARLKELAVLGDGGLHEGREWGIGEGPVLVDPSVDAKNNPVLAVRGRVLGGGRAIRSRGLGFVLKPKHQNVFNASRVANAVNRRFHRMVGGIQQGVAKAINDQYVELAVHPRYKDNVPRYMQVVRSIAIQETSAQRIERLALLEKQLLDPISSARAARQLEAVGRLGVDVLKKGITSDDREVRFHSAEALAYLDQTDAAKPLGNAARNEPAFRVFALGALGAMDDFAAYEELCSLLDVSSAETRYGAFRALWTMNPKDGRIRGETFKDGFAYHVIDTQGPPMIHVSRSRRPELVVFGRDQRLATPLLLEAGPRIRVTGTQPDEIAVSRFVVGEPDQKRIVSTKLDDVVRAIVDLGGSYPDVVQALQEAKAKGSLPGRFEVDALPEAGRLFERDEPAGDEPVAEAPVEKPGLFSPSRLKSLFGGKADADPAEGAAPAEPE